MKFQKSLLALALVCSPVAFAADQGSLDTASTGKTDVTISLAEMVKVTVGGDISLTYDPDATSDTTGSTTLCIYTNGASANIGVTVSALDNVFGMAPGLSTSSSLPYAVDIFGADAISVAHGVQATVSNPNTSVLDCASGNKHNLRVTVTQSDLEAAAADDYEDTITILAKVI